MRYNSFAFGLAALAPVALGQTTSLCDPLLKDDCPPNEAFGKCGQEQVYDFSKYANGDDWRNDKSFLDLWIPDDAVKSKSSKMLTVDNNGAVFTISGDDQAPLIKSKKYLFFGKLDVTVKAAPGRGIVTSIVLESDDRDEIDWEWVGASQNSVQTNFFSKGVNDYTHGKTHTVSFNPMDGLHTYSLEWTESKITFSVDGAVIRTATPAEADNGAKWPQTPTMIKLGTWVGGRPGGSQGTIDWAGGLVNMAEAPFVGYYKEIKVTDYCGGYDKAEQYVYGDNSGTQGSIKVEGSSKKVPQKDTDDEKKGSEKETSSSSSASDASSTTLVTKPSSSKTGDGEQPAQTTAATAGDAKQTPDSAAIGTKASSVLAAVVFIGFLVFS